MGSPTLGFEFLFSFIPSFPPFFPFSCVFLIAGVILPLITCLYEMSLLSCLLMHVLSHILQLPLALAYALPIFLPPSSLTFFFPLLVPACILVSVSSCLPLPPSSSLLTCNPSGPQLSLPAKAPLQPKCLCLSFFLWEDMLGIACERDKPEKKDLQWELEKNKPRGKLKRKQNV